MAEKMPYLFVALINEVFGTSFSDNIKIETHRNEFITKTGKIITDSIFAIEGHLFHIECQSNPDNTMAIRMFEYDFSIALEEAVNQGDPYEIKLPESCVIYIRSTKNTPDTLTARIRIGNEEIIYSTKVIKAASYTLNELISKDLKVLLPYYMVRYEKLLPVDFIARYKELLASVEYDLSLSGRDLIDLIRQITERVAPDEETRKEVSDMGGKVLELWSERKFAEGKAEGRIEGRIEGYKAIYSLVQDGYISPRIGAEKLSMSPSEFEEAMEKAGYRLPERV